MMFSSLHYEHSGGGESGWSWCLSTTKSLYLQELADSWCGHSPQARLRVGCAIKLGPLSLWPGHQFEQ
jgi:hypothetical protein